jgi:acetylornithine deacetylase
MAIQSGLEEKVVAAVRGAGDELAGLTGELIAYDTTARMPGEPARDEEALQRLLQQRLVALGAETDLWEPPATGPDERHVPPNLDFKGRPQLAARLAGGGGGRSLVLCGHIDAVAPGPPTDWQSDPFKAVVRDGRLYGRGACDMKGGLAALIVALEALHRCDVRLLGDVVWCSVTDEESSGAGGWAAVARGVEGDGGLCAEATAFDAWIACRGTVTPTITVLGRAGHAEIPQPAWRAGGAVNAVEKAMVVLHAVQTLRDHWRARSDLGHPLLSVGDVVPTIIRGGDWQVTYPSRCEITCDVTYLPAQLDDQRTGRNVERELRQWIDAAAAQDDWLSEHPLEWAWDCDVVPAEMPADHPLVGCALGAAADLGHTGRAGGLDSWHDAATFTAHGTPMFSFGPDGIETAHAVNECVGLDDLADAAAAYALTMMRWCGV